MEQWRLPNHWKWLQLENLLADTRGGAWGTDDDLDGTIVLRPNNIGFDGYVNFQDLRYREIPERQLIAQKLATGDIILTKSNSLEQIGRCAYFVQPNDNRDYIASNFLQKLSFEQKLILPKYGFWFLQSGFAREYFQSNAKGSSASLKNLSAENIKLLSVPIPYPDDPTRSLAEQRRIVARIEALFAELRECRALNGKIQGETEKLFRSFVFSRNGWTPTITPMHQLVQQKDTDVVVQDDEIYHFAGVRSFGRGVFSGKQIRGSETSYSRLTRISTGNFTYPKLMAWEGALGMVPASCDGHVVSPEYPVFEVNEDRILPETLDVYFRTATVWPTLAEMSTGSNARRRRLHPDTFLALNFPLPPKSVQHQLRLAMAELSPILDENEEQTKLYDQLEQSFLAQAFRGEL